MIYLIPAWYKQNSWNEYDQCWYVRRKKTEYDDTVKQMQLFHRSKAWPCSMIVLSYMPNLRHFLHRQGMFRAPYWSCFDAMLEISRSKVAVFSFKNLKWPEGTTFEYTAFAVIAYVDDIKYAKVDFGEDGNLIKIDMYENENIIRTNFYDDRGFVSSSIVYENGKEKYQDYIMENGVWKLRHFREDGHVEINPKYNSFSLQFGGEEYSLTYNNLLYESMDDVIKEVLVEYIALTEETDIFCVAAHSRHQVVVAYSLKDRLTITSFFEDRIALDDNLPDIYCNGTNYIVTDTAASAKHIQKLFGDNVPVIDISPYDTRTDFGISQQMPVYKILVVVDDLEDSLFQEMISALCTYLQENSRAEVHYFTRSTLYDKKVVLLSKTREVLKKIGADERIARDNANNPVDIGEEDIPIRFFVEQCVDELSVSRCMREQRIMVDLSDNPDIYVQIAAISSAIPQIVKEENQFLQDGENGMVVDSAFLLLGALRFYLNSLANWNEAMICASEICKRFSADALLNRWSEVISEVGGNKDTDNYEE